jgi:hypothetical protein
MGYWRIVLEKTTIKLIAIIAFKSFQLKRVNINSSWFIQNKCMWGKVHDYLLVHHQRSIDKNFTYNYSSISLIKNNNRKLNLTGFRGSNLCSMNPWIHELIWEKHTFTIINNKEYKHWSELRNENNPHWAFSLQAN